MAAWLMVSVKTQTLGPNAATFASGQMDEAAAAAVGRDSCEPHPGDQGRCGQNPAPPPAGDKTSDDPVHTGVAFAPQPL